MKSRTASLLLLITATIWGTAFVAQEIGSGLVGPFTFNWARNILAFLFLIPFAIRNNRKGSCFKDSAKRKDTILGGILCGVALTVASLFQQMGVGLSGAGKSGFITSLYNIIVPMIMLLMGRKVPRKIWACVAGAIIGMYLLCINGSFVIEKGDRYLLLCAISFAFHILTISHFSPRTDGVTLSAIQFLTSFLISFVLAIPLEGMDMNAVISSILPIAYAGIFSSGIAYTLQIVSQKYVPPTAATLIMSLESVIAALSGWLFLGNGMSMRELIGCGIVFASVIFSQLG